MARLPSSGSNHCQIGNLNPGGTLGSIMLVSLMKISDLGSKPLYGVGVERIDNFIYRPTIQ